MTYNDAEVIVMSEMPELIAMLKDQWAKASTWQMKVDILKSVDQLAPKLLKK